MSASTPDHVSVVDEVDDEPAQLRRVLDAVLRLAEDEAEQPRLGAEALQQLHVVPSSSGPDFRRSDGQS